MEDFYPLFEETFQLDNYFSEEYLYLKSNPDFKKIHIGHLSTLNQLQKLKKLCESSQNSYCNLILGLFEEHGLLDCPPNYSKALFYYEKGANLNESYCLYRLFYIFRNELDKFNLKKNPYIQFSYLLKAAAYFDEKDNRFSDKVLDPILHLAVFYDADKEKMDKILEIYLDNLKNTDETNSLFLKNWFFIKFPTTEEIKKKFITNQKNLSIKHPEAAYHIGDNHRWGGETLEKESDKAEKYLTLAANENLSKAVESLAIIYIEENNYEKAILWLQKGATLGSYLCIKFLGEYEISGKILPQNIEAGLKKLKHAFYLGDFWAAWTIIIVYKYIKNLSHEARNKKVFKYSNVLFSSKDIMGNIVYITIRHSSLASCYEKSICLEKDLKKALNLHLECLSEIKRECWKGYTYYKVGKLYEKLGIKAKADEFYYKGFKSRAEFIRKEHKKEPPHYYNYAKMFEFGRGVAKNLSLAQKYYKLGGDFKSFLSFHMVYGQKCQKRLFVIDKEINRPEFLVNSVPIISSPPNKKLYLFKPKQFDKHENIYKDAETNIEIYLGVSINNFNENQDITDHKLTKSVLIYRYFNLQYEKYWKLVRNIFILEKYPLIESKCPKVLGIYCNADAREIHIICNNEQKFQLLKDVLSKTKSPNEIKNKIIYNLLSLNYKNFFSENQQLFCEKFCLNSFLIHEKENFQIYFNLPLLLNGEVEINNENKLVHDIFNVVKEIMETEKEFKFNECSDPMFKNLYSSFTNSQKNWTFEDLHAHLNLNHKVLNKSKFFNF